MKKIILSLTIFSLVVIIIISKLTTKEIGQSKLEVLKTSIAVKSDTKIDHSKFPILKKKFASINEVTRTCISCHTERHKEVMQSNHWNWEKPEYIEGRGIVYLGKKNVLNNFCIGATSNELACAKCHIGSGMTNDSFKFTDPENIDCLVCHDNTETYAKAPDKGGAPMASLDFNHIAQNVGSPQRSNCGVCHFYGGGGDNVKHGDLGSSMFQPTREIDIHMDINGTNMSCVECHKTENHMISGKLYSVSSMNRNRATCEQCHTANPHQEEILNKHTYKVACQTCHIPTYAKGNSTKLTWDWSTAGKLKDGKPYHEEDELGNHSYLSIKGTFEWGRDIQPEYVWFNGTASHYLMGDEITDTVNAVQINSLHGSYADKDSKIIPVKIHRAKQPFDPITKLLIQPHLFGTEKGEGAYWKDFDWSKASLAGMKTVGFPSSGKVSFIKTEMYWPVNHMVAPKEESVQCTDCHNNSNSRLAGLNDFYMPARDKSSLIEFLGKAMIAISILIVLVHGTLRIFASRKRLLEKNNG